MADLGPLLEEVLPLEGEGQQLGGSFRIVLGGGFAPWRERDNNFGSFTVVFWGGFAPGGRERDNNFGSFRIVLG